MITLEDRFDSMLYRFRTRLTSSGRRKKRSSSVDMLDEIAASSEPPAPTARASASTNASTKGDEEDGYLEGYDFRQFGYSTRRNAIAQAVTAFDKKKRGTSLRTRRSMRRKFLTEGKLEVLKGGTPIVTIFPTPESHQQQQQQHQQQQQQHPHQYEETRSNMYLFDGANSVNNNHINNSNHRDRHSGSGTVMQHGGLAPFPADELDELWSADLRNLEKSLLHSIQRKEELSHGDSAPDLHHHKRHFNNSNHSAQQHSSELPSSLSRQDSIVIARQKIRQDIPQQRFDDSVVDGGYAADFRKDPRNSQYLSLRDLKDFNATTTPNSPQYVEREMRPIQKSKSIHGEEFETHFPAGEQYDRTAKIVLKRTNRYGGYVPPELIDAGLNRDSIGLEEYGRAELPPPPPGSTVAESGYNSNGTADSGNFDDAADRLSPHPPLTRKKPLQLRMHGPRAEDLVESGVHFALPSHGSRNGTSSRSSSRLSHSPMSSRKSDVKFVENARRPQFYDEYLRRDGGRSSELKVHIPGESAPDTTGEKKAKRGLSSLKIFKIFSPSSQQRPSQSQNFAKNKSTASPSPKKAGNSVGGYRLRWKGREPPKSLQSLPMAVAAETAAEEECIPWWYSHNERAYRNADGGHSMALARYGDLAMRAEPQSNRLYRFASASALSNGALSAMEAVEFLQARIKETKYVTAVFESGGDGLAPVLPDIAREFRHWLGPKSRLLAVACEVHWSVPEQFRSRAIEIKMKDCLHRALRDNNRRVLNLYDECRSGLPTTFIESKTEESCARDAVIDAFQGIYRRYYPDLLALQDPTTIVSHQSYWTLENLNEERRAPLTPAPAKFLHRSMAAAQLARKSVVAINMATLRLDGDQINYDAERASVHSQDVLI